MTYEEVIAELESRRDPDAIAGMARYGITPDQAFGIKIPVLRQMAKRVGKDHALAQKLWESGIRETQILASMVDDPQAVTGEQMESWASAFSYWEICDQCCMNLFERTPFAWDKCFQWSGREEEFVKRAGFVLMARLAVSDKSSPDERFLPFFVPIELEAVDNRNYVRKAVNWALRQIGKRSPSLNRMAIETAGRIQSLESSGARWIAADALRELRSEAVQQRLKDRQATGE